MREAMLSEADRLLEVSGQRASIAGDHGGKQTTFGATGKEKQSCQDKGCPILPVNSRITSNRIWWRIEME